MSAVTITLPLPPTANTYWRFVGRRVLLSEDGRAFKTRCALAAQMQRVQKLEGEIAVSGVVYMARRGCDLDNRIKPLLDGLKGVAWKDDVQVASIALTRDLDHKNPRVEIQITPISRSSIDT